MSAFLLILVPNDHSDRYHPTMTVLAEPTGARRPRNRRQLIIAAAADQFWTLGYHQVGMADIAAAVGIAPSALYRHFRGKAELLIATLDEHLTFSEQAGRAATGWDPFVATMAAVALDRRAFGVLWEREAGHLPAPDQRALRHRLRALAALAARAGGPAPGADLRAWAMVSVWGSPSHHRVELDRQRFEQLLRGAVHAIAATSLQPDPVSSAPVRRSPALAPTSRREALIAAAIRLFAGRGYHSVGLTDIGAAAGITGPSVYHHFDSKVELLCSALQRGTEAIWLGLHQTLASADDAAGALRGLVAHYTAFALAFPDIIGILITEIIHLPPDRRTPFRRTQHDYVTEWVALLCRCRPELDEASARTLVHTALAVINSTARIEHLRARPHLPAELERLAVAVLDAG